MDLEFTRKAGRLSVRARSANPAMLCLVPESADRDQQCTTPASTLHEILLPLPAVELQIPYEPPRPGARTSQIKVTGERQTPRTLEVDFEAPAGSNYELPIRLNQTGIESSGGELLEGHFRIRFPDGSGNQRRTVRFRW
jgi:hypothetical protein